LPVFFKYCQWVKSGSDQGFSYPLFFSSKLMATDSLQQKSMSLCHAINNVRTHWAVPCRVS